MRKLTQKQQKQMIDNYKNAKTTKLNEIYQKASNAKWQAYFAILDDMKNKNGKNEKVFNANCMQFSMAFEFEKNGKNFLQYETKCNRYIIPLE